MSARVDAPRCLVTELLPDSVKCQQRGAGSILTPTPSREPLIEKPGRLERKLSSGFGCRPLRVRHEAHHGAELLIAEVAIRPSVEEGEEVEEEVEGEALIVTAALVCLVFSFFCTDGEKKLL